MGQLERQSWGIETFGNSPGRPVGFKVGIRMRAWIVIVSLVLLSSCVTASEGPSTQEADRSPRKLKVVFFGGHPDDPESGAGGLAALLTRQGHEVILAYGTAQPRGSQGRLPVASRLFPGTEGRRDLRGPR